MDTRIATAEQPANLGKPLLGDLAGLWRYRVGNYRVVCRLEQETIVVFVLSVGHRKDVYDPKRFLSPSRSRH